MHSKGGTIQHLVQLGHLGSAALLLVALIVFWGARPRVESTHSQLHQEFEGPGIHEGVPCDAASTSVPAGVRQQPVGESCRRHGQLLPRRAASRVVVPAAVDKEVTLLDYGAGNVRSVRNAIMKLGYSIKDVSGKAIRHQLGRQADFPGCGQLRSGYAHPEAKGTGGAAQRIHRCECWGHGMEQEI
eukprot:1159831-Pelagomonas_calceolata.AAC.10